MIDEEDRQTDAKPERRGLSYVKVSQGKQEISIYGDLHILGKI